QRLSSSLATGPGNGLSGSGQPPVVRGRIRSRIRYPSPGAREASAARRLWRHADDQFAEVAALEQAHERSRRVLETVDDVLAELEAARHDERPAFRRERRRAI